MEKRILVLSPSTLNDVQTCDRKYYFLKLLGLTTPGEKSEALLRGNFIHKCLEHFYFLVRDNHGLTYSEKILDTINYGRTVSIDYDLQTEQIEHFLFVIREYCLYYQVDKWEPVEIESPFSYTLFEDNELVLMFEGRVDLVVKSSSGMMIVDHKSESRDDGTPTSISNQFMGYAYIGSQMGFSLIVCANRIGIQKTKAPQERFQRSFLSYTQPVLEEWRQSVIYWAKNIIKCENESYFPPRFVSCKWCSFKSICETDPSLREWKLKSFPQKEKYDLFGREV